MPGRRRARYVAPASRLAAPPGGANHRAFANKALSNREGPLFRHSSTARNGDIYLVETETYLVGPAGNPLTADATVPFSALHELPLVLFCRPNSWRDRLDQISSQHGISLNVVLEADCLALQTHVVADGGGYALLGPYALSAAAKECRLAAARLVEPSVPRHIALSMSPHGELTLACRTVMKAIQEIVRTENDGLSHSLP